MQKKIAIVGTFIVILFGITVANNKLTNAADSEALKNSGSGDVDTETYNLLWSAFEDSDDVNYDILLTTLTSKIDEYYGLGHFNQGYQPSLQATYYALYILQAIDKLDAIDKVEITEYIMSNYNTYSRVFIDEYGYRYLDTDFSKNYYPLTTVLEVNCYAILSLEMLNQSSLIDKQAFIDFVWSCYNPITSGFVGQPYSSNLNECFRTSTLDNTYYAIKTLNALTDWSLYPAQKSGLVTFINGLQSTDTWPYIFGGFLNDYNTNFLSLYGFDTNLLSCYYGIKSLEILNLIETINLDNFRQYLSGLYDTTKKFFKIDYSTTNNDTNLAASAIGLELSKLTQFTECDQNGVVNFLLKNRNSYGTWDCSTEIKNRELIDTFEVIRAFKDTGAVSNLTTNDKIQIYNALQKYFHYKGFSLISDDYLSVNLIYTIVNSFNLRDKISDLPINYLYNRLLNSSIYGTIFNYFSFHSCVDLYSSAIFEFRSKPLEYYTDLEHEYVLDNNKKISHKSTYYALDSLLKLFKLDDFALKYNLNDLVASILNSQFLDSEYENYGAFLPTLLYQGPAYNSETRNGEIEFKYSYYAIKALELLSGYLGLGKVKDLGININALFTYLNRRIITTPDFIYFCDNDYDTIENKIQKTYYMAYILNTLEIYSLDDQKIKNFVEQNLDYSNVKNMYYSWKVSELLNLDISFDLRRSHDLVSNVYDQSLNEFYLTTNREKISQEALLWIQEMAKLDKIKINCTYEELVNPGSKNNISVSLSNIILNYFGPTLTVKYESEKIGTIVLKKDTGKNSYSCEILVSNNLYQSIEGRIVVYDGITKIGEKSVIFYINEILPSPTPSSSASEEESIDAEDSTNHNDEKIDNAIPLVIALLAFPATVITISYKMKRDSFIESDKN